MEVFTDFYSKRDSVIKRHDDALNKWPNRSNSDFQATMKSVIKELQALTESPFFPKASQLEQCRTLRWLGDAYFDLANGKEKGLLQKAATFYGRAEDLLSTDEDSRDLGILNMNFANILRGLSEGQQLPFLFEAKRRYFIAKKVFEKIAPELTNRVNQYLESLQLQIEMAENYQKNIDIGKVLNVNDVSGSSLSNDSKFFDLLYLRYQKDKELSKIDPSRVYSLDLLFSKLKSLLNEKAESAEETMLRSNKLRELTSQFISIVKKPSYGFNTPQEKSKAAQLISLLAPVKEYLLNIQLNTATGQLEKKEIQDLFIEATLNVGKIYEIGDDDMAIKGYESEVLRPLSLLIRDVGLRKRLAFIHPIWSLTKVNIKPNSVVFSGSAQNQKLISKVCQALDLDLTVAPIGDHYAESKFQLIWECNVAIFDYTVEDDKIRALVSYELGIARTLGKSVIVLAESFEDVPFDEGATPVLIRNDEPDTKLLESILLEALYWFPRQFQEESVSDTIHYANTIYQNDTNDIYIRQSLTALEEMIEERDPFKIKRQINTLLRFKNKGLLINSTWPIKYPNRNKPSLFHITPYNPKEEFDQIAEITAKACKAQNIRYIRGDKELEPKILSSIVDDISRATHLLVDLTNISANVCYELAIAHVIGRRVLIIGRKRAEDLLFPNITKVKLHSYTLKDAEIILPGLLNAFLKTEVKS